MGIPSILPLAVLTIVTLVHGASWQPASGWSLPSRDGYVAFGDSFAAGIGTGATSWDGCRVGEYGYPTLLSYLAPNSLKKQSWVCSGDTITGLNRQVGEWIQKNDKERVKKTEDLVTVTIGGNDLEFSNLVDSCVLWASPFHAVDDCQRAMDSARRTMKDIGNPQGLHHKIYDEFDRIVRASRNDKVHVYVTGYPTFFNAGNSDCNKATFYYWRPDRNSGAYGPKLTTQLRTELNRFTVEVNSFLRNIVTTLNRARPGRFTFVDPEPAFEGHRFCEPGVKEPDANRAATWFFLSGWEDVAVGGTPAVEAAIHHEEQVRAEHEAIMSKGRIELPHPEMCLEKLPETDRNAAGEKGGVDIAAKWNCTLSHAVNVPNSHASRTLNAANHEIAAANGKGKNKSNTKGEAKGNHDRNHNSNASNSNAGNGNDMGIPKGNTDETDPDNLQVNISSIAFFYPTSQIKTFHPRAEGQWSGYVRAIWEAMEGRRKAGAAILEGRGVAVGAANGTGMFSEVNETGVEGVVEGGVSAEDGEQSVGGVTPSRAERFRA
ncbi:MAG: hypothetical protein M1831_005307 [Alyxoria varia]|nr:MAG: hypothetical protein M1831_005307 [Alyxoria varia]